MDFRPLATEDRDKLREALRLNVERGNALRTDRRDTSFVGTSEIVPDDEVITAIRSVPCHYAGSDDYLYHAALELLRGSPEYAEDAEAGAPVGNSVVGSLLAIQHSAPRQYTERAVMLALATLRREEKRREGMGDEDKEFGADRDDTQCEPVTLQRTGNSPLTFTGELLASANGERQAGKEQNRWHEVAVYRTGGGRYVVSVHYRTRWQGELDHGQAEVAETAAEAAAVLRDYDPCGRVQGYPAGDHYAEKQSRLMADLRARYDTLVSEVLSGEEFAERVE